MLKSTNFDYELIDCGDERRIERFGKLIIDRPCPQAEWGLRVKNIQPDVFFERNGNQKTWKRIENFPERWNIQVGKNKAHLKFSPNGQVGIFPEQFDNWQWIEEKVNKNPRKDLKILNTFSYTGMSTLFSSADNTEVCHVDGSKSAINGAKKNAEVSGKKDAKIRWICDDVSQFLAREIRRGNKYDGIILDPPSFGRGAKKDWKIERDLKNLMDMVGDLLGKEPLFVILTCHATEFFCCEDLADILEKIPQFSGKKAERLILNIPSEKGNSLPSSFGARIS